MKEFPLLVIGGFLANGNLVTLLNESKTTTVEGEDDNLYGCLLEMLPPRQWSSIGVKIKSPLYTRKFSYLQNFAYLHASFDYEFAMDLFDRKTLAVISAT